ncbi:Sorting nexin mvp1 [Coemansia spiralis]|uniref:Sorting nexin MVP1 n=2 Tax=Coemansia TaxID=4863 RepID=A0A9W8G936_9FUNG|nr:Sorting nexin mvp1 [Coemansia umbellata]KAJ2621904.1 Sorting nexin mvp1 [Coemansia sp. RSA 1358]KAJ2677459.1 Sorting nexin mvp1 [Coemansia spiralis]
MSDLYDILDPWGPSGAGNSGTGGPSETSLLGGTGLEGDVSRSCLDKVILPPIYAIAYSAGLKAGHGTITRDVLQKVIGFSGLPRHIVGQIILAADLGTPTLSQRDFNLALAMTALAQKNMPPTIEGVAFHKDDLPVPELNGIESLTTSSSSAGVSAAGPEQRAGPSSAFPDSSDDPWFSSTKSAATMAPPTAGMASMAISAGNEVPSSNTSQPLHNGVTNAQQADARNSSGGTAAQTIVPSINMDILQWQLDLEDVSIKESAEKGGIVFKHTNYEVSTRSFTAMVVRRYNDFFWISNYLIKRYPYRMHPNIPPKGFPVDRHFLDNRIKGLTRFSSAILRIPFLRRDALVIQFFTNTDEFSRVIKVGNLDTDAEDFDPKEEAGNTPWIEIQQTYVAFDDFYHQVAKDEEKYRTQITALEKIARYKQAIGDELYAYSDTLRHVNAPVDSITGSLKSYTQSKAKRALNTNLNELSMSFCDVSLLDKSQGEVMKTISSEYLRRMYDVVISMKLMMDRMRIMDKSKEAQRIRERNNTNRKSLAQLNGDLIGNGSNSNSNSEQPPDRASIERLERLVREDTEELNKLELEQQRIELRFYQELARYKCYESFLQTHYHRFMEEQIKHHTLVLNAWKQALVSADDLPTNPLDFIS